MTRTMFTLMQRTKQMNNRFLLPLLGLLLVAIMLSCSSKDAQPPPPGPGIQFTADDSNGSSQVSNQWIGKQPVVLNFWGTWCPPCRQEIPDLIKLYDEYHPKGVEMLGLSVGDSPTEVRNFSSEKGMKWIMLMANDGVKNAYQIGKGVPVTIFLDKDGKEVKRFVGNQSYEDFKPFFEAISGQDSTSTK
jgi:thiol-disulfide isomerase/thioredoxin